MDKKYELLEQIGSGSFGFVYKGRNKRTDALVAVKVEPIANETKLLKNESAIYQFLKDSTGIPTIRWFGKDTVNYYMVIDLLGPSLEYMKQQRDVFSLRLALQVGIQLINLLMYIHDKGLVHRDIKPDNFLLGLNDKQLYIIDFGFCKTFIRENKHIPPGKTNNIIGTLNYASINAHDLFELSRRDDMESLGYLLIYLVVCQFKWGSNNTNQEIKHMKNEMLACTGELPAIFLQYMVFIRSIAFEERPDYSMLIDIFKNELLRV